jgi:hypothetical protein
MTIKRESPRRGAALSLAAFDEMIRLERRYARA